MIFFCEECGEKNDLEDIPLLDGKVVFQCRKCGYGNTYSAGKPETGPVSKPILKKNRCFPQEIGFFSYHTQNGLMENQMPAILSRADVETLGGKSFKFGSLSRTNNRDVLMFPVGSCFLGVVKQAGMDNAQLADSVMESLARHSDSRDVVNKNHD